MSHPLQHKLAQVRSRLRRMLAVYGVCCVVAAVMGAAIGLGLADYLLRLHDAGMRVILTLTFASLSGWAVYRYLYGPLASAWQDVELAQRIEVWQPVLGDRLRSAIEFIRQSDDDALAGSAPLRRAVIAETTLQTENIDFRTVLDPRPVRLAMMTAAGTCLVAAILAALDPQAVGIAMERLTHPLGSTTWPRQTHLMLRREVTRVARGQAFEVELLNEGQRPLPAEVRIHYRWDGPDGAPVEETETMHPLGRTMAVRRENITRAFAYRAEGGDDQTMPWIDVEVVEPPQIASAEVRVLPPAYAGWPEEKADGQIRALAGSQLVIHAMANKPLKSAAFCLGDGRCAAGGLSDDGLRIIIPAAGEPPLMVEQSGSYWFKLVDRDGLTSDSENRGEILAIADTPPAVVIEQPTANLAATGEASVPLRATVKDDLAICRVSLVYARSDRAGEPEVAIPLYTGPPRVEPRAAAAPGRASDAGERRTIEYLWNLAALELVPGAQVTFHLTADDYRPQSGKSDSRRLTIITVQELHDRISARQNTVLAEIDRVLQMQRTLRAQIAAINMHVAETTRIEQADVQRLQGVELNQRQIDRSFTGQSDGLPSHIRAILDDLKFNKLDNPDVERGMEALLAEIDRLTRECLPENTRQLTSAMKAAQIQLQDGSQSAAPEPAVTDAIAGAGKTQDAIIESLQRMRSQLAQWDDFRRFHRELSQLAREQEEIALRTAETGRRTLTRPWKELAPAEIADLKVLAGRQFEVARRMDRAMQEMRQAAIDLQPRDPTAAQTMTDAFDEAQRLGVSARMRDCGNGLQENQIGHVVTGQKTVSQGIQEILDILANRRRGLAEQMTKLEEAVGRLRQRQEAALIETRRFEPLLAQGRLTRSEAAGLNDLAGVQASLGSEAREMVRKLEGAAAFAFALSGVAGDMDDAAAALKRRQPGDLAQMAQRHAIARLDILLEAMKPELADEGNPPPSNPEEPPDGAQPPSQNPPPAASKLPPLAALKLLKLLQGDINARTVKLQEAIVAGQAPSERQAGEFRALSDEQIRLAEIALKSVAPAQAEGRPKDAPEVKEDEGR